jgi:hypothetical protein
MTMRSAKQSGKDDEVVEREDDLLDEDAPRTASELFAVLWERLADILGTSAVATLLRRSAKSVARRRTALSALAISRNGLSYGYVLPISWEQPTEESIDELRELICELWPLLIELTGSVVVKKLQHADELVAFDLIPPEEEK